MKRMLAAVNDHSSSSVTLDCPAASIQGPSISVVVPTFNEVQNIKPLVSRLSLVLAPYKWEVIFVDDDSSDLTWKTVKEIALTDSHVRCLRRVNRRGLSGACIEGILSSSAPLVVVMDGDLQHDESIIPRMIESLKHKNVDLVVGSRYIDGGSCEGGFNRGRAVASKLATFIARKATQTDVRDIMSGFFAVRRESFESVAENLSTSGFKILLDLLTARGSSIRVTEIEYKFRVRGDGTSKFDLRAMWDFIGLLVNKTSNGIIPTRLIQFAFVGSIGIIVHLFVLSAGLHFLKAGFETSQFAATCVAMTSNFFLNNLFTYRDKKLKGLALIKGLLVFYLICSAGILSNIGIAAWLFGQNDAWWLAGLVGAIIGTIWNYTISSALVWRQ